MRAIYSLLLVLLLSKAAAGQSDFDQITNHMAQQSKAWNTGDVSGFMDYYWKSDSLRFIGKRGITWGWQSTFDNYKKSYPDKAAMGTLKFGVKSHEYLAQDKVLTIGTLGTNLSNQRTRRWNLHFNLEKN